MRRNKILGILFFIILISCQLLYSQENKWVEFRKDSVKSTLDNATQYFFYFKSTQERQPLIVSLHQWGADYMEYNNSLAIQTKSKNWNFIHPDFRGANKHIKACGSEYVINDIDEAIDWAIKNMNVDINRIYIVGASGGGYAALCNYMKSRYKIKEYSVWVPIVDLGKWYFESKSRKSHYAKNIISCTCENSDTLNMEKARERSPLYWKTPLSKSKDTKINIYAGVNDGYVGAVPITHSINFYNKIITDWGGKESDKISKDEIIWLITARTSPPGFIMNKKIEDRKIIYYKTYKNISITIFDGGHEILIDNILDNLN